MPNSVLPLESDKVRSWQCPPREAPDYYRAGWISELVQNGDAWTQAQPGIRNVNKDIQLLMGLGQDRDLESNLLQPDIRTFVETITDLRQIATLGSRAEEFSKYAALYNDVFRFTYWDSEFVSNMRRTLQYAMVGRGYLWQKYSRDKYGWGRGKIVFDALGPREFLPEQLPADNDVQGCYAGTIVRPMPVAEAHARFPAFQQWLTPIGRMDWKNYGTLGMARRMDFYDRYRFTGEEHNGWENRYCEIRYSFIRDLRINDTGRTQQMGIDGTSWGYQVPSLGDLLVTINPANGLPESRKAGVADCRMYPQLRLVITSPGVPVPLYDDTAFNWHGEIPVSHVDVNDWAWSAVGYSSIQNVKGLEIARRDRISDMNTVLAVQKDPPLGHDVSNGVARTQMEKLDLLHAQGMRLGGRGDPSKWTRSLLPEGLEVSETDFKGIDLLGASIKATLGLTDLASMREVKGNMSDESMDKFVENLGPMAKGIAVNIWRSNNRQANMLKFNIAQFYTVEDLLSMVGPEGVGLETFDNDPNSIIPSHLTGEDRSKVSNKSKRERSMWFCEKLRTISTPAQLLNITHQQERMIYMMLFQKGAKISNETVFAKLGIEDYDVQHKKWEKEQVADGVWELEAKATIAAKQHELGLDPPPEASQQGQGGGRPNSFKKPNHPEGKGSQSGNVRAVNSTS